jgi:hypothetical protein
VVAIPDAARRQRPDSYQSDTADQQGRFKLHGLVPGEYAVIALEDPEEDYRDPEFLKKSESSSQAVRLEKGTQSCFPEGLHRANELASKGR